MKKYFRFLFSALSFILPVTGKAETINKADYIEYYNKGVEFYQAGKLDLALKLFNKGIEINPNDSDLYNSKGVVLSDLGKYDLSLEASLLQ
ncbi:tetratricopeptide repeat protein [Rickettsia endosymbiont of Urophora cardui]|uniref:tetratricopeptide repeat protein n=1 Tax=Rickettsia endosymbiont of Urophora cardui TaxID=3066265 RepID=UPI00313B82F5